jgi:outer membrane protein OmpA-like peptidoglycan-associated protein
LKTILRWVLCVVPLSFYVCPAQAQTKDATGCKDSALVSRFPGTFIKSCTDKADESHDFEMGDGKKPLRLEGEFHEINYSAPQGATKAQVVRNLHAALQSAGYVFDYDSGGYGDLTAHLGKTWIGESVGGAGQYTQSIVIQTKLTQDVVATAAALSSGLAASGHIVVNGILFDTGKAEVKPESGAALQEIVKLLKQDPKLKLYVVGHTDNVGVLAANVELSRRRAAAVVQVLTSQYSVDAGRLQPYGDGPYAPLASNDTEDGRTLNRRVELVKQ